MTALDRGIAIFGTQQALADASDCYPQEISRWKLAGGIVPKSRCEKMAAVINAEIPAARRRGVDPRVANRVREVDLNPKYRRAGVAPQSL